jgi:hypothetical protein
MVVQISTTADGRVIISHPEASRVATVDVVTFNVTYAEDGQVVFRKRVDNVTAALDLAARLVTE